MSELVCKEYRKGIFMELTLYHIYEEVAHENDHRNLPTPPLCNKQICYNCVDHTVKSQVAQALASRLTLTIINCICLKKESLNTDEHKEVLSKQ